MRTQFIVKEKDTSKRRDFYHYIKNKYKFEIHFPYYEKYFINYVFPFVIDFKEKSFWICDSITCLACAAQEKVIIGIDEFYEQEKELLKIKKYRKLLLDK